MQTTLAVCEYQVDPKMDSSNKLKSFLSEEPPADSGDTKVGCFECIII